MFKKNNSVASIVVSTLVLATTILLAAFEAGNYFRERTLVVEVATIMALDAALILLLYLLLRKTVIGPLREINRFAVQVSAGEMGTPAYVQGRNFREELHNLGCSIEEMVRQMKASNKELQLKNSALESAQATLQEKVDELELQIGARKQAEAELSQQHDDLEETVKARTAELETAQEELLRGEKLAVLGQLTATVSHELRNPLGVIQSSAFYLQRKLGKSDEKVAKHLARIEEQVGLCDTIVAELLEYTRGRLSDRRPTEINSWLTDVLAQVTRPLRVSIARELSPALPTIYLDQEKMRRVVINLVNNALQAVVARREEVSRTETEYAPQVIVRIKDSEKGLAIEVEDNGTGMNEETAAQAFDPLFTTRARGTGLGLAIVKKIVEEHGGNVYLSSKQHSGTKITVVLPFERPFPTGENSMGRSLKSEP